MRTPFLLSVVLLLLALPVSAQARSVRVAVLGDSLTAGYGLTADQSFPAQLEIALRQCGYRVEVQNAGISGDTSAGGLARLDWLLESRPDLVLVELGGNDALRGLDPELTRVNLDAILGRLKQHGVQPLLIGMRAPRNLGRDYYTKFDRLYPELAERHGVPFYPFFLEGVAGREELNSGDGIHPNAAGIAVMVRNILPVVERSLKLLEPLARQRKNTSWHSPRDSREKET
ncbi:MAG TPA: arylesterase [Geothermobacteraceae bacterium]|nr:arylesterase [Geothermobacteraceae bacterium]